MKSFSEIYILDLHGNAKKKERCPDGTKDENVFDIQQGVTIGIFVKQVNKSTPARVYRADLWGLREIKYQLLFEMDIETTPWKELKPQPPLYLFAPLEIGLSREYDQGYKITEIMPLNGVGITTARDGIVIYFEKEPIIERARVFRDSPFSDQEVCSHLSIPLKKGWNIANSRKLIREVNDLDAQIKPISYRPFDNRLIFYHDSLVWRTAKQVMGHMLAGRNLGLISARSNKSNEMNHFFATSFIMEAKCGEGTTQSCIFPLYLYSDAMEVKNWEKPLFSNYPWVMNKDNRIPNLNPKFVIDLEKHLNSKFILSGVDDLDRAFGPEDVLHYIYAIFHCPTYRTRYAQFMKRDFPRIPLTSDRELFRKLCAVGKELFALHLLESPALEKLITRYPVSGNNLVQKGYPKYETTNGRVNINKEQYFEGVPLAVWEFQIGGYQVCEKWLRDRRGRQLSYNDLTHYQKIIVALNETIRLMKEIDGVILNWPIQ